ncbi:hypothetical protein C8Q74DRAFT_1267580 [Fomes fomentarius]|nr:hypothetical protein C8Q74DRAFT_1267580 [Fomes fomentarius]
MSRFMLNLQAVNNRTMRLGWHTDTQDESESLGRISLPVFNGVNGSLGSSVVSDMHTDEEEVQEGGIPGGSGSAEPVGSFPTQDAPASTLKERP